MATEFTLNYCTTVMDGHPLPAGPLEQRRAYVRVLLHRLGTRHGERALAEAVLLAGGFPYPLEQALREVARSNAAARWRSARAAARRA